MISRIEKRPPAASRRAFHLLYGDIMKRLLACSFLCLVFSLFTGCDGDGRWDKIINGNRVSIVQIGEHLEITVFIPAKNLGGFEDPDSYTELLEEALTDYLKLSDDAEFKCPGLETVSEKAENDGRMTIFRIPETAVKVNRR